MWGEVVTYFLVCSFICILKVIRGNNNIRKLHYYFNFTVYYFILFLSAVIAFPFFLLRPRDMRNGNLYCRCMKYMNLYYGLEWRLRNGEILSQTIGAVIISNHQSEFDALAMVSLWNRMGKLRGVIKKELLYAGLFGVTAYLAGAIYLDRKNPKSAYKSLQTAAECMTKDKTKIWMFPEGTRNKERTKKLLPFKKGAFNMAVTAQVPIIPVVFSPHYFIDRQNYILRPGYIIAQCLEPVSTVGLTLDDVPQLTNRIHAIMTEAYGKLWDEVNEQIDGLNLCESSSSK